MENLRQPNLPWWVTGKLNKGTEQHKQVRLLHDTLAQLGVYELGGDVGGLELFTLGHLGKGLGQVNNGVSAIFGRDEKNINVLAVLIVGAVAEGQETGLDWRDVRGTERDGGEGGAEVGLETLGDGLVGFLDVTFEDASFLVDGELSDARASAPGGNVGCFVDELFEAGSAAPLILEGQDDAEVFGKATEVFDITLY